MEWIAFASETVVAKEVLQAFGVLGFLLYIAGFAALQTGHLDGNGLAYTLCSVSAATCVLISLAGAFNLASLLIQVSWICIGIFGIWRRFRLHPQSTEKKAEFISRRTHAMAIPRPSPKAIALPVQKDAHPALNLH